MELSYNSIQVKCPEYVNLDKPRVEQELPRGLRRLGEWGNGC